MAVMPDLAPVFSGELPYEDVVRDLSYGDLVELTGQIYDTIAGIIGDATDAAVVFLPKDPAIADPDEPGWTLGHAIVHLTAGLEEGSAQASSLARGVQTEGRSRHETPWDTITTVAQVQQRLAESRRMCEAFLDTWPDEPHLENTMAMIPQLGPLDAIGRYVLGLFDATIHLEQLREIMRQASA